MMPADATPLARFLATLDIVRKAAAHLVYSRQRLCAKPEDTHWVSPPPQWGRVGRG